MKFIRYFTAADQSARYSTFFTASSEKSGIACWLVRADQSARYSTFFTANSEKSGIASWLVRAEYANCCHRIVETTRTWFRKLCFFSYSLQHNVLHKTSKTTERRCSRKRISHYSVVSQPPPYEQKKKSARCRRDSQRAARSLYSLWKQFENYIFWL